MSNSTSTITTLEEFKKLDTNELIEFLRGQQVLHLIKEDFDIISDERITGYIFLDMNKDDFLSYGLKRGPASSLAKFAKECKDQMFSSDMNVKESMSEDQLDQLLIEMVEKDDTIEKLDDQGEERKGAFRFGRFDAFEFDFEKFNFNLGDESNISHQENQLTSKESVKKIRKIRTARSRRR